ncbi:hypothetical protein ACSSS7_005431 [Eimeria intestinalis]
MRVAAVEPLRTTARPPPLEEGAQLSPVELGRAKVCAVHGSPARGKLLQAPGRREEQVAALPRSRSQRLHLPTSRPSGARAPSSRHRGFVFESKVNLHEGPPGGPPRTFAKDEKQVPVPACVRRLISKRNPQQLLQNLLSCSLAVFDLHNSDPDELEFIFKKLRQEQLRQPLCVVLISSVLTWSNTRRQYVRDAPEEAEADEGNGESVAREGWPRSGSSASQSGADASPVSHKAADNEVLKPQIFSAEHFELRVPSKAYEKWKMVETLLMSLNSKENFRGVVVAAGMMYGYGEETLYDAFKAAWLGLQTHKLVGEGNNFVPTVHVQDLCSLVKAAALDASKTAGAYHLAVDRAFVTQRQMMESIVNELGSPFEVKGISAEEAALIETAEILSQDFRFKCSPLMNESSFFWHAKEGPVVLIKQVASEFCQWRGLRQLKIFVTGPPGSGRTTISERLAQHYNICHIKTAEVVERGKESESDASGACGVASSTAALCEDSKKKVKKPSLRRVRLEGESMAKLFRARLSQNVCRYRGFVLDGYPKSYEECTSLFLKPKRRADAGDSAEELQDTDQAGSEGVQHQETCNELDALLAPDFVVSLSASMETCERRLMNLHPSAVIPSHNDREGFRRRYQIHVQQNESVEGKPRNTDFFQERGVEVLTLPTDGKSPEELFASCVIYLSRSGPIRNFLLESTDWLTAKEEALKEKEAQEEQEEQERERREREEEEQQLQKQRERDLIRLRRIADYEQQLLLMRSIPLRRYLMQHVIPTLSEGLLEVCRVLPEDPVSYLTAFLFAKARQMQ